MTSLNKIALLTMVLMLLNACTGNSDTVVSHNNPISGAELFKRHCVLCHGVSGNLGLNGARDLSQSRLSREQRIEIISNGKAAMPIVTGKQIGRAHV